MTLFTDNVQSALERAMDGVAMRQRISAQNIANALTPGYKAQTVSFESDLASALANGQDASQAAVTVQQSDAPADERGNSVDLATESTSLMTSGLQYESLVAATNYRLGVLRAALR
jgi:flagellar basal-body rod protein FlgB